MPDSRRILRVVQAAITDLGLSLWLVGGGVRDLALGAPLHDLDLAVDGAVNALIEALQARLPDAQVEDGGRFGTATLHVGDTRVDLARLRTERYVSPGALPDVSPTRSMEKDLRRRDFSVNAMALGLAGERTGELVDPFDGMDDLAARRLRVLHDRSFVDDATRLWRGARTAALFRLTPDPTTARLIEEGGRWLEPISGERLQAEMGFTARRGYAGRTLALLHEWGVLTAMHPAFTLRPESGRALARRTGPLEPALLAAVLMAPLRQRRPVLDRVAAPREWRVAVEDTARLLDAAGASATPDTLRGLEGAVEVARTAARWLDPGQRALQADLRRWERARAPLTAEALIREGVPPGPALGRTLRGLRRARYLGTLKSAADARREVRRRLAAGEEWDDA